MAGLSLNTEASWMVSRWIFRQLLESTRKAVGHDSEVDYWLQMGIANDMLDLTLIDSIVSRDLVSAVRASAERQLGGDIVQADLSADDQAIYLRALRKLVEILDAQK